MPTPATLSTVLVLYSLTIFLSAALLFLIQPMAGKILLPALGGSPAVWNTCMLFFQGVLLLGYAYSHVVSKLRRPREFAPACSCSLAGAPAGEDLVTNRLP